MATKREAGTDGALSKIEAFEAALKTINNQFKTEQGDKLVTLFGDKSRRVETISSGSLVLDSLAGGGLPVGRIIEIYGPEASGKTSIALTAVGNVQKNGGNAVFIDLENALDPAYATKLGVDMSRLGIAQPDYAEQALELVEQLAASGSVDIIVVDSVAALVPKAEFEGTLEDQNMALLARILSRSLKKLANTANKNKCTVIFINQLREKVGFVLGNPETTTGGKALKFFASQRIDIRRKGQVKEGTKVIGTEVKIKIVKNKIAPPFQEAPTVLTFNQGINKAAEMVEVGPNYGVITKPNARSYIETETGEPIASSKADAIAKIEGDSELQSRLSVALAKAIEASLLSPGGEGSEESDVELDESSED